MNGCSGSTETKRKISLLVPRCAAHPAPRRIRLVRALLENCHWSRGHIAELEPTYSRDASGTHAVVPNYCFVVAEVAICQSKHQPVANAVQPISRPGLRNTTARGCAKFCKSRCRRTREERKRRVRGRSKVHMEVKESV